MAVRRPENHYRSPPSGSQRSPLPFSHLLTWYTVLTVYVMLHDTIASSRVFRVQMQEDLQTFTDYYKKKHQGRILNWDHALGTATLKGRFDPGPKELSVSLYQAIILLMFNDVDEISFVDIKEQILLGQSSATVSHVLVHIQLLSNCRHV